MDRSTKRQQLTEQLKKGVCNVTFIKVDGTERTMPCTLREDLLPPARKDDPASQKKVREISDAVMVVYCTDKKEWRSFRIDNVTNVEETEDGIH